jgi:16S rRNA (guanine527-N7)-methyltransferase
VSNETSGSGARLNAWLVAVDQEALDAETSERFETYVSLILRWNERLNLTSIRVEDAIIIRHLAESILCAKLLPSGLATLLDFGSGAGLPGIPIALCRPEIAVTLAESQTKKAAFLQEAVRVLGLTAKVHAGRAEMLPGFFDCVVLRAVDKMPRAVAAGARLTTANGFLALMTTGAELARLQESAGREFAWISQIPLPDSRDRIIAIGRRSTTGSEPTPR